MSLKNCVELRQSGEPEQIDIRRRRGKSIDYLGTLTLVLGTIALFAVVGFLAALWHDAMLALTGREPGAGWTRIALSGWVTRSITICTAIMRLAISTQAGLLMSMVAALVLEGAGAPAGMAALLSIMRAVRVAPHNMWPVFKVTARRRSTRTYTALITGSLIVTVISQFASTILLSDVQSTRVKGLPNNSTLRVSSPSHARQGFSVWKSTPIFRRFAETFRLPRSGESYYDTGLGFRAFLPYASQSDRASLREYAGPAAVTETRVVCFAPTFASLTYTLSSTEVPSRRGSTVVEEIAVDGEWANKQPQVSELDIRTGLKPTFNCTMPFGDPSGSSWPLALCSTPFILDFRNGSLFGAGYTNASGEQYSAWIKTARQYLVFNNTAANATNPELAGAQSPGSGPRVPIAEFRTEGVWTKGFDGNGTQIFSVSACQTGFAGFTANATMKSRIDGPTPEPDVGFDRQRGVLDTGAVRHQLRFPDRAETGLAALESRGILQLEIQKGWAYDQDFSPDFSAMEPMPRTPGRSPCIYLFSHANMTPTLGKNANENLVALVQDTLKETGGLALALEVMFSSVRQTMYHNNLARFAGPEYQISTITSVEALSPVRWIGFAVVMALIFVHLFLLTVGSLLFGQHVRLTMLGNAWQAVAQLVTEETLPLLEQVGELNDEEVKAFLAERQTHPGLLGIVRSRANRRIELRTLYK